MTTKFSKRLELDSFASLVSIFDLMLTGGIQPEDLMAVCARAVKQAEARVRLAQSAEAGGLVTAALVLDAWHRDRRYRKASAVPRAAPFLRPARRVASP